MQGKKLLTVLGVAVIAQGALALPAVAADGPRVAVMATGLDSPRGITVAPDGSVYVAESGTGGDHCITEGEGDEASETCFGTTSSITRIEPDGTVTRGVVEGIASMGVNGQEFIGASDVAVADDGTMYVTVGLGESAGTRDAIAADFAPAAMFGTVQRVEDDGSVTTVADIAAWEGENNPDGASDVEEGSDSNPDAVLVDGDNLVVADAGGNTVLSVDRGTGAITLQAVLEARMMQLPPEMGGGQAPVQAVPTSLATSPNGDLMVGQLTGGPFPPGEANVYTIGDDGPEVLVGGFSAIMGVGARGAEVFVLEMAHDGLLNAFQSGDFTGALVRVRPDGSRIALLRDVLQAPGDLAIGDDGIAYMTNGTIFPGGGSVVAFDPSQAADPATQSACPPDSVPGAGLSDIADTTFEEAIVCTAWHGLFGGYADGSFRPGVSISRGNFAATVARLVAAAGGALPEGDAETFSDVDGVHAPAINGLAEAEIVNGYGDGTFRPGEAISRAEATSIVVRAYDHLGEPLPAGTDAFADDDGSVHEPAIDAAHAAGWVNGTGPGQFSPAGNATRGQVAAVLARVASTLVDDGLMSLPS